METDGDDAAAAPAVALRPPLSYSNLPKSGAYETIYPHFNYVSFCGLVASLASVTGVSQRILCYLLYSFVTIARGLFLGFVNTILAVCVF